MKSLSKNTKSYAEKLKDPRWQKKRLESLELADWECSVCQSKESTLHVHHHQYLKGREPWEYESDQLEVLCEDCHKEEHEEHDVLIDVISRLPIDGIKWIDRKKAAYLIAGVLGLENFYPEDILQKSWFHAGLQVQGLVDELFKEYLKEL
jgi:hypothetical protein